MVKENLNELLDSLIKDLRKNDDLFKTKIVIFPNRALEAYFKSYYLKKNDEVLMNVKFFDKTKGFYSLFDTDKELARPYQIRDIIINYLSKNDISDFSDYFDEENLRLKGIKLFDVASKIQKLFSEYDNDLYSDYGSLTNLYNYVKTKLKDNNLVTLKMLLENFNFIDISEVYLFGFINETNLINELIDKLSKTTKVNLYELDIKGDVAIYNKNIIKAPSKIKEIEALHSTICKKLLDKNVSLSDFLVVGGDLSEYRSVISRVFNQDDENFPKIPYAILSSYSKDNEVYNALTILSDIYNQGYFSRPSFCDLINNKVIASVRGLTDSDIKGWTDAIIDMNVYNNYVNDDFEYAKYRMLLSKISDLDNVTIVNNTNYIPYSSISLDDDSITKFIEFVDDLSDYISLLKRNDKTSTGFLIKLKELLDKFFSIKDENDIETTTYYKNVSSVLDFWINNKIENVPITSLIYSLIEEAKVSRTSGKNLFNGVSFIEVKEDFVTSAKFVFFIGLGSANFPKVKEKNPFDNRDITYSDQEQEKIFKLTIKNAKEFYVSYVYKDLATDEEFFLSPFVKKYTIDLDEKNIKKVSIDEDRSWRELFTKKEYKDKAFSKDLLKLRKKQAKDKIDIIAENKPSFTINQIGKFLAEPLNFKAEMLFGSSDDKMDEALQEFEDIKINPLDRYNIFKDVIEAIIKGEDLDEVYEKYSLSHTLPQISIDVAKRCFNDIVSLVEDTIEVIGKLDEASLVKLDDYLVDEVNITNQNFVIKVKKDDKLIYAPLKDINGIKNKDILTLYAFSLVDVAGNKNNETVNIELITSKKNRSSYTLNRKEALSLLKEIITDMLDYKNNCFFDFGLFKKGDIDYYSLIDLFNSQHLENWSFSKYKDLFDAEKDLGYSNTSFDKEFGKVYKNHKRLIQKLLDE